MNSTRGGELVVGVGGVTDAGMLVMLLDIEAVICGNAVKLSGS